MLVDFNESDLQPIEVDDNSVRLCKNDCVLFVRPVPRGHRLCETCADGVKLAAPLIRDLGIPIDVEFPDNVKNEIEFVTHVLTKFSFQLNVMIIENHSKARLDNASLYIALIELDEEGWVAHAFSCHKDRDCIVGVDNLLYLNISKRLDSLSL